MKPINPRCFGMPSFQNLMRQDILGILVGVAVVTGLAFLALCAPGGEQVIGSCVTSMSGRTGSQIHNVRLACKSINDFVIMPGRVFSFVQQVGSWTADKGYVQAPVSYDGEMVRSWGGGVCQASTTLYNAALNAGLEIVERHRHHWPAHYAPPGLDAAVAYRDIDLRIRNDLPEPVRIIARVRGDGLVICLSSKHRPRGSVKVQAVMKSVSIPRNVIQNRASSCKGRWQVVNRGRPGFEVVTYRWFETDTGSRGEIVSRDRYPVMNQIVRVVPARVYSP
jgi:vancomycin resistance protein VanW